MVYPAATPVFGRPFLWTGDECLPAGLFWRARDRFIRTEQSSPRWSVAKHKAQRQLWCHRAFPRPFPCCPAGSGLGAPRGLFCLVLGCHPAPGGEPDARPP